MIVSDQERGRWSRNRVSVRWGVNGRCSGTSRQRTSAAAHCVCSWLSGADAGTVSQSPRGRPRGGKTAGGPSDSLNGFQQIAASSLQRWSRTAAGCSPRKWSVRWNCSMGTTRTPSGCSVSLASRAVARERGGSIARKSRCMARFYQPPPPPPPPPPPEKPPPPPPLEDEGLVAAAATAEVIAVPRPAAAAPMLAADQALP